MLLLAALASSCGGGSGSSGDVAFILNKSSGQIVACRLTANGLVNFAKCQLASKSAFDNPIDMVMRGSSALFSVAAGIEQCTIHGHQLTDCTLAIEDGGFPVGLTLENDVLFVADYSAKSISIYDAGTLAPLGVKSLPTAPTDVVFNAGLAYIVTQDVAGSVVLACDSALSNCASVYNPLDRALLAITISNGVAFMTDASGTAVVSCDIGSDGGFSNCTPQGDASVFNYPYGITIRDGVAYIPNRAEASVAVCDVDGATLLNCAKSTNALLDGPTWVVFPPD